MDTQTLINTAIGIGLTVFGWFARTLWESVCQLQSQIHEIEVDLPKSYVSKDDFNNTMKHIEDMFQRIYDKLDHKADK
jgi:hypothetical protein